MATTTNYGWETPDDTDLVKDGASAIRTLGSSIDTTTKALNPETTLGDISYRSSTANTNTRLAIGTTGQVLTVSGGVPAWSTLSAGGMTLLSTTTLANSATTISSISQDYTHLYCITYGVTTSADYELYVAVNNAASTNTVRLTQSGTTTAATGAANSDYLRLTGRTAGYVANNNNNNAFAFTIYNYASTAIRKVIKVDAGYYDNAVPQLVAFSGTSFYNATTAVSSLVFNTNAGTFSTGTVLIYGVK